MDRRRFLSAVGAGTAVALAGCTLSSSGDDEDNGSSAGDDEELPEDETGEQSEESTPLVEDVQTIKGIGPAYADRLAEVDIETVGDLLEGDVEAIAEETGIAAARVEGWMEQASE